MFFSPYVLDAEYPIEPTALSLVEVDVALELSSSLPSLFLVLIVFPEILSSVLSKSYDPANASGDPSDSLFLFDIDFDGVSFFVDFIVGSVVFSFLDLDEDFAPWPCFVLSSLVPFPTDALACVSLGLSQMSSSLLLRLFFLLRS